MFARLLQDYHHRFAPLPSSIAASVLVVLAVWVLVVNLRRPINQAFAGMLICMALWQGGIALIFASQQLVFLRFGVFFGGCTLLATGLLIETISDPWSPVGSRLQRMQYQVALLFIYPFAFTDWYIPTASRPEHPLRGSLYWVITSTGFLWTGLLLLRGIRLIRSGEVTGIARIELSGMVMLLAFGGSTFVSTVIAGSVLQIPHLPWLAPVFLLAGLVWLTIFFVRAEVLDARDLRRFAILAGVRACLYFPIALLLAAAASAVGTVAGSITATAVLLSVPAIDRQIRRRINRKFESQDFLAAQAAANALVENTREAGELHAGFIEVLRQWSGGSPAVFLSGAAHAAPWPAAAIPRRLLAIVAKQEWTTPEILDRAGTWDQETRAYVVDHNVAAIVCHTSPAGDRLVAAFKTRVSRRPFVSRELREAHRLLQIMQLGLSFVRLNQRLRGVERLQFYAQYAPQFAHELRNGLYLPTQLLRAVQDGRIADVLPADAKAGLENIEQVDRLCDQFSTAGALFARPVQPTDIRDALASIVDRALTQGAAEAGVQLHLDIAALENVRVRANLDLLGMAVRNLVRNAVEALAQGAPPRSIEITASINLKTLHLLIQDNGPGLPEERLRNPFAPGRSGKRHGMGLGLSISRDCIEAMGGMIGVRSSGPRGTCFEITLNCV